MDADPKKVKSYILWYNSKSHGAKADPPQPFLTRYFVGFEQTPCLVHGYHLKPSWSYDKGGATVLDGPEGPQTKEMAEICGYTDLVLEPIDEQPSQAKPDVQKAPAGPSGSDIVKSLLGLPQAPKEKVH